MNGNGRVTNKSKTHTPVQCICGGYMKGTCPECGAVMERLRVKDYVVTHLCHNCRRTFYYQSQNKRYIELAIPYRDFEEAGF